MFSTGWIYVYVSLRDYVIILRDADVTFFFWLSVKSNDV